MMLNDSRERMVRELATRLTELGVATLASKSEMHRLINRGHVMVVWRQPGKIVLAVVDPEKV